MAALQRWRAKLFSILSGDTDSDAAADFALVLTGTLVFDDLPIVAPVAP